MTIARTVNLKASDVDSNSPNYKTQSNQSNDMLIALKQNNQNQFPSISPHFQPKHYARELAENGGDFNELKMVAGYFGWWLT